MAYILLHFAIIMSWTQVVGDVEYLNRIPQESSVSVKGEVKQLGSQAELPQIRIEDYDPKGNPTDTSDDLATLVERTEAEVPGALENPLFGFQRFSNDVSFPDGLTIHSSVFQVHDVVNPPGSCTDLQVTIFH